MQVARTTTQHDAALLALTLVALASMSTLVAGVGIVNYLNGNMLRAVASLVVPAFLGYWAWQARDNLGSEPLIPIFGVAWLAGLPVGWAAHAVRQLVA